MSRTMALILVNVAMMTLVVAAAVGLDLIGAKDEVLVLVILLIAAGTGFAVSEVVGHYADRDDERQSH
jgi:hypothetical protein